MGKILAFGASNSRNSINKKLAAYVAGLCKGHEITVADLNDYVLPLYGIDYENENGIPENAHRFAELINAHDGLVISLAEHNSNFSAAFKNLGDWISRLEGSTWRNKKTFLLATSNGKRGGQTALEIGLKIMPFRGADIKAHFSLPNFSKNYIEGQGIQDEELRENLMKQVQIFDDSFQE